MKYIPADKLKSIIKAQIKERNEWMKDIDKSDRQDQLWSDLNGEDMSILQIIASLQQEKPEYGHFVSYFISGKKSIFNVGDILAYYICTSNEEGERNIGKIEKVVFDEEENGWIYTFENGDVYSEEELVSDDFYKKN